MRVLKILGLFVLPTLLLPARPALARTVEAEVYGMTCAFCVDTLQREFKKMDSIASVDISLKSKMIRLQTEKDRPTIETIRQTIRDAGFTPEKITIIDKE